MDTPDSDVRPGYARLIRALVSVRAALIGGTAFFAIIIVASIGRERDLNMLAGNAILFALVALVLWMGFRDQRRTHVADTAQLLGGALSFTSPSWSGVVTPEQVVKVRQVRSNPVQSGQLPRREWRHWICVDLSRGAQPGATTLYIWTEHPVTLLDDLGRAGFPVKGRVEEP